MKVHAYMPLTISNAAQKMLLAVASSAQKAGHAVIVTRGGVPTIQGDVLLTYGAGGELQRAMLNHYKGSGLRTVALDQGYWNRGEPNPRRCFRFAVDGRHPTIEQVQRAQPCTHQYTREQQDRIINAYDPRGHVIFARMGAKSIRAFPDAVRGEQVLEQQARTAYGGALVVRAKEKRAEQAPIRNVLAGAAGVVTWSSNCALDAASMCIPFHAPHGVAAAYSQPIGNMRKLSPETAAEILGKAGAFQVSQQECQTATGWAKIARVLA